MDEDFEMLKTMARDGYNGRQISEALDKRFSREAVVSKASREGVRLIGVGRPYTVTERPSLQVRLADAMVRLQLEEDCANGRPQPTHDQPAKVDPPAERQDATSPRTNGEERRGGSAATMLPYEPEYRACRWFEETAGRMYYCHRKQARGAYCEEHAERMYVTVTPSARARRPIW
jgi:hypothetical protein